MDNAELEPYVLKDDDNEPEPEDDTVYHLYRKEEDTNAWKDSISELPLVKFLGLKSQQELGYISSTYGKIEVALSLERIFFPRFVKYKGTFFFLLGNQNRKYL